jgi:hypothetical protein
VKRSILLAGIFIAIQGHAQSVGDIAKQNKPKDAKVTSKRVFTDDDVSHTNQIPNPTPTSLQDHISNAESAVSRLAEKSARQLSEDIVRDVQFPDRSKWEQQIYDQKEKVVAAARALVAVAKSDPSNNSIVSSAKFKFDIEMTGYNNLKVDGLAKAADWERQTRK